MRAFFRVALALFFVLAGANHFWNTNFYVRIMPPYVPYHLEAVYLSGVLEIIGGLGVLLPATRRLAGIGLILLLIVIFPANIHMALNHIPPSAPRWVLWLRLPIQLLFIAWVWWTTLRAPKPER